MPSCFFGKPTLTGMREIGYMDYYMSSLALDVRSFSRLFKALGEETRLRIVALLSHGELCVCHLEAALKLSQPKVSRHLATLRAAGVVEDRRDGTWVYYRLVRQPDADCERQLRGLVRTFAKRGVVRKDLERLIKVRGPESCK
jgi:ArsR family transcriptional regulator